MFDFEYIDETAILIKSVPLVLEIALDQYDFLNILSKINKSDDRIVHLQKVTRKAASMAC